MQTTVNYDITLPLAAVESKRLPDIQSVKQGLQDVDLVIKTLDDKKVDLSDFNSQILTKASNVQLAAGLAGKADGVHSHNYSSIVDKPTKLSDLVNDIGVGQDTTITATVPGNVTVFEGTIKYYPVKSIVIRGVDVWVSETLTSDLVVRVNKNSAQTENITISAGSSKSSKSTVIPLDVTDYLTISVVTGSGKDLVVRLKY